MNTSTYQIALSYNQILDLVKQLPNDEKKKLGRELAKETLDEKLSRLLDIFSTGELSEEEITHEVEKVRSEIYARQSKY